MNIFTFGHSSHTINFFIDTLKHFQINCVIDIRSVPYSKYLPHFNKEILCKSLIESSIIYMHFGKEFGARKTDTNILDNEMRVDFEKIQNFFDFISGVKDTSAVTGKINLRNWQPPANKKAQEQKDELLQTSEEELDNLR